MTHKFKPGDVVWDVNMDGKGLIYIVIEEPKRPPFPRWPGRLWLMTVSGLGPYHGDPGAYELHPDPDPIWARYVAGMLNDKWI